MTQLSSAAQSVFNALGEQLYELNSQHIAAAVTALRAAADQAAPEKQVEDIAYVHENYVDGMRDALDILLAIAAELEGR